MTPPKKPTRRPAGAPIAKTETSAPILTADELALIKAFRTMDARGRQFTLIDATGTAKNYPGLVRPSLRLILGDTA
jgi:hypothetical protein